MLTWKRPQKHHPVKEHKIPVILRYRMPKSVHGARRNLKSCSLVFIYNGTALVLINVIFLGTHQTVGHVGFVRVMRSDFHRLVA